MRRHLRECLNLLDAKKNLYGPVEFTLSLGTAVRECGRLVTSLEEARGAVLERLVEGPGRLLEGTAVGSGLV